MPDHSRSGEKIYRGLAVSAGICRGPVVLAGRNTDCIPTRTIEESELPDELARLEKALVLTRQQILEVQRKVGEAMGADDASIFDAHLLVLEDRTLLEEVTRLMEQKRINVEYAFSQVAAKYANTLAKIDDEYLRERAADMRDVTARILNNLQGREEVDLRNLTEPCILVSYDLAPSSTAMLDKKVVLGFVTELGGRTSHTAIMARSLQIPAVVGIPNLSQILETGQYALLDGYNGLFIVNPTDQTLFEYGQLVQKQVSLQTKLKDTVDKPAVTLDGSPIVLSANIELATDADAVKSSGANGVGLFRTEYLFIKREILPTEEEQFEAYRSVAQALNPSPVIIRTLDLGGDKFLGHLQVPSEVNPFLGWRAIRFCLQEKEIFRAQLRAILRASAFGNVKMMYPMISCLEELEQASALVEEYKAELTRENVAFNPKLEIGVMIEIPSAVVVADSLAKRVSFFSIGTNDLIQYTLAVDRLNDKIAHLYAPTHPAILQLIKMTVEAAHRNNIWVGVCGEMASDAELVPLLLGLGVDELSASPAYVPQIKFMLRRLKMGEARGLVDFALQSESPPEILKRSQELARKVAPDLFQTQGTER